MADYQPSGAGQGREGEPAVAARMAARGSFWTETQPHGESARDRDYWNGQGADRLVYRIPLSRVRGATAVRATLYYQAIPPHYLAQRFGIRCAIPFAGECDETAA